MLNKLLIKATFPQVLFYIFSPQLTTNHFRMQWTAMHVPLISGVKELCCCYLAVKSCGFCNLMDYSPLGSSVHGISQARILEWVAIPSPGDLPNPGMEPVSPTLSGRFFTTAPQGKSRILPKHSQVVSPMGRCCSFWYVISRTVDHFHAWHSYNFLRSLLSRFSYFFFSLSLFLAVSLLQLFNVKDNIHT